MELTITLNISDKLYELLDGKLPEDKADTAGEGEKQ